jgi:hypothetical protein
LSGVFPPIFDRTTTCFTIEVVERRTLHRKGHR